MKRALAVLLVCMGFAAFAQFPAFKGSWSTTIGLIPSVALTSSTLTLTTTISGFDVSFAMRFTGTGLDRFSTTAKGGVGPFTISSGMYFNPVVPEYMGGFLSTALDFAGLGIGVDVYHWDTDYPKAFFSPSEAWPFLDWYDGATTPCPQTNAFGMLYKLTLKVDPITAKLYFVDCCDGIEFDKAVVGLKGIGLCCGIALDAEMAFTKVGGFSYLKLTGLNIPLCCGVSLDVTTTFTVDSKKVELKPKFAGFAEACFTVWGDAVFGDYTWGGIEIWGYRISCTIADCNTFEIIHAWNVAKVNPLLPTADQFSAACGEFELYKLTFCGPGCCGGRYTVALRLFFGSNGGLFDITRLVYSVSLPIMTNFSVSISGTAAAAACATNSLSVGWTFTF